MDFDGPLHGKEGRIPVRRIFPEQWTDHAKAAAEAFKAAGFEYLPDQNGEWQRRLLPDHHLQRLRAARVGGHRLSRSRHAPAPQPDDLDRHAGGRAAVRGQALRRRGRAASKGARTEFRAREVILSCGAIHSPAHLLRAGIGPVGHLKELGIEVRAAPRRRRPAPDGPPLDLGLGLRQAARAHERVHAPPHPRRPALLLQHAGHARGRHVRRRHHQVGLARGRASASPRS